MLADADWGMIGAIAGVVAVVVSVVGGAINWYRGRRRDRAAQAPRVEFSDVYLAGPGQHPRTAYAYAFAVELTNTGGGPARHVTWGYLDEQGEWFAEFVHRPALAPGERTQDWSGIRGEEQGDNPSHEEALAFHERCIVFAMCWDSRDKRHVFFPFGGGRLPWWRRLMRWRYGRDKGSFEVRQELSQFPSRGEARRSLGAGVVDAAFKERKRRRRV